MKDKSAKALQRLRAIAEKRVNQTQAVNSATSSDESLLHELQVHQIELEMQNEQLHQMQTELEKSRDRYAELYEFAPTGYLSISTYGMIESINLTATVMLGVTRKQLINKTFSRYVAKDDRDYWHRQLNRMNSLELAEHHNFDIRLNQQDGGIIYTHLSSVRVDNIYTNSILHISITDITERKKQEDALRIAATAFESQEGMMITDANQVLIQVNKAFTTITGYYYRLYRKRSHWSPSAHAGFGTTKRYFLHRNVERRKYDGLLVR